MNKIGKIRSQRHKMTIKEEWDFASILCLHFESNICRYNLSRSVRGLTPVPWLEFPNSFTTICLRRIHPLAEWMALILRSRGIKAKRWEGGWLTAFIAWPRPKAASLSTHLGSHNSNPRTPPPPPPPHPTANSPPYLLKSSVSCWRMV
jgi:hypothetical protein